MRRLSSCARPRGDHGGAARRHRGGRRRRRGRWSARAARAVGLASCSRPSSASSPSRSGFAAEHLIADLFALAPWLGWLALGLAVLALVAFLGLVLREIAGIWRERRIEHLRSAAIDAAGRPRPPRPRSASSPTSPPSTAARERRREPDAPPRPEGRDHRRRRPPQDRRARAPRPPRCPGETRHRGGGEAGLARHRREPPRHRRRRLRDLRRRAAPAPLSEIYGGRPGALGFLRLARAAFNHLAVTGGVAVGDSLVQQALGLGLAARISAKLGEGVLNGLMTARFGLAALNVCRPLPFIARGAAADRRCRRRASAGWGRKGCGLTAALGDRSAGPCFSRAEKEWSALLARAIGHRGAATGRSLR